LSPAEVVPTCVWRARPELLLALDERFGDPVDAYVNGSQVWLRDDGPGGASLEWRLHPVAGFSRPAGVSADELLGAVVFALRAGEEPPAPVEALWDGLEAFPAFGDDVEPAPLAAACTDALGLAPDVYGMVDHTAIGDRWEAARGQISIVGALIEQLGTKP
jgi:hypothetical protein